MTRVQLQSAVHPAFEDGTDTGFRNVGQLYFDAGEIPRRKYTNENNINSTKNIKKICPLHEHLLLSTALQMLMISSGSAPVTQLLLYHLEI